MEKNIEIALLNIATARVLRAKKACLLLGISLASFHGLQQVNGRYFDPTFPAKVPLGLRSVGYFESELLAWAELRREAAQKSPATSSLGRTVTDERQTLCAEKL